MPHRAPEHQSTTHAGAAASRPSAAAAARGCCTPRPPRRSPWPTRNWNWRSASMKGMDSMSPTCAARPAQPAAAQRPGCCPACAGSRTAGAGMRPGGRGPRPPAAHRAAQLDDADVGHAVAAVHGRVRHALNPVLDGVGDVRHHLRGGGGGGGGPRGSSSRGPAPVCALRHSARLPAGSPCRQASHGALLHTHTMGPPPGLTCTVLPR